jgi:hypothetical protein
LPYNERKKYEKKYNKMFPLLFDKKLLVPKKNVPRNAIANPIVSIVSARKEMSKGCLIKFYFLLKK